MRAFLAAVFTAVVVSLIALIAMYVLGLLGKAQHAADPGAKPQYRYTYLLDA